MKHCLGRGGGGGGGGGEGRLEAYLPRRILSFPILLHSMSITLNMGSQSAEASLVLLTSSTRFTKVLCALVNLTM